MLRPAAGSDIGSKSTGASTAYSIVAGNHRSNPITTLLILARTDRFHGADSRKRCHSQDISRRIDHLPLFLRH